MDLRVNIKIGGSQNNLQFHSLKISQAFFQPTKIYLVLGYYREDYEQVSKTIRDTWQGNKLEIEIYDYKNLTSKKYNGIIFNIKITKDEVHIISYSKDYLMNFTKKYKGFTEINALGIVKDIISNYLLNSDIKSPVYSQNFNYFQQYNETDWECLLRLAEIDGCVFYDNGEIFIYTDKPGLGERIVLSEEELFDAYFDCSIVNTKFRGAPYNFLKNSNVSGSIYNGKEIDEPLNQYSKSSFKASKNLLKNDCDEFFNYIVNDKQQYEKHLQKRQLFNSAHLAKFYGKTNNHTVCIGSIINGTNHNLLQEDMMIYYMEAIFDSNSYVCNFVALEKDSIILPEISKENNLHQFQTAIVIDNIDPQKLGRVKIQFIWDYNSKSTTWARVLEAGAGLTDDGVSYGTHYTPRVGDYVLIGFEISNSSYPIVLGALYHSEHKPDFKTENGTEEALVVKTPLQSTIRILDKKDSEEIIISMRDNKNIIKMELKKPKITIQSVDGTIDIIAKDINITADNKIKMSCKDMEININNKMTTNVNGDSEIKVGQSHKLSASQNITQEAKINVEVTAGQNIKTSASMNNEVLATQKVGLKGSMVESTASTNNVIKGAQVLIN